jgi:hypothetical protein
MRSRDRSDRIDLDQDLPATPGDIEALRRVKTLHPLTLEDYLRFLDQLPQCAPHRQAKRGGARGDQVFTLD